MSDAPPMSPAEALAAAKRIRKQSESSFERQASRFRATLSSITARPLITMRWADPQVVLRIEGGLLQQHAFERPFYAVDLADLSEVQLRQVIQQTIDQGDRLLIRKTMTEIRSRGHALHLSLGDLLGEFPL